MAAPQKHSELNHVVDIDGGLLLSDNTLYVISYRGRAAALDMSSDRLLWQRKASSCVGVTGGFGNIYVSQVSGSVEDLDSHGISSLRNNDVLARHQLSAPTVFSNNVAIGDLESYVHLLSQVDGCFVDRERVDSDSVRARPLVVRSWMYVFGNGGKLVAYTIH